MVSYDKHYNQRFGRSFFAQKGASDEHILKLYNQLFKMVHKRSFDVRTNNIETNKEGTQK